MPTGRLRRLLSVAMVPLWLRALLQHQLLLQLLLLLHPLPLPQRLPQPLLQLLRPLLHLSHPLRLK